jgi:ankyrin repeat protein
LAAGAELDTQDDHGETALMKSAFWGNRDVVSALLTAGADPKIQDKEGRTAVTIAEEIGQTTIADLLRHSVHFVPLENGT